MARPKAQDIAAQLGLTYQKKAPKTIRDLYRDLPQIKRNSTITHLMTGTLANRPLTIFQSMYMVQAGNTPVWVYHTIYSTTAPPWPLVKIKKRSFFDRLLKHILKRHELELDDPEFNQTMRVETVDEDTAIMLLTPDMQRFFLEKPTIQWFLGHVAKRLDAQDQAITEPAQGRVDMVYSGRLKPDRIADSLVRLERFWSLVPDELCTDGY